jgi:hypothetical protein
LNPRELMLPYDLLAKVRSEIDARLWELQPSIEEYEKLLAAADALEAEGRAAMTQGVAGDAAAQASPDDTLQAPTPNEHAAPAPRAPEAIPWQESSELHAQAADEAHAPTRRQRVSSIAVQQAIVAALEHGSHTVGELVIVTALSPPDIRAGARRLLRDGKIVRIEREGKAAYALPAVVEA